MTSTYNSGYIIFRILGSFHGARDHCLPLIGYTRHMYKQISLGLCRTPVPTYAMTDGNSKDIIRNLSSLLVPS